MSSSHFQSSRANGFPFDERRPLQGPRNPSYHTIPGPENASENGFPDTADRKPKRDRPVGAGQKEPFSFV